MIPASNTVKSGRIALIDVARGIALLAMAIYHFSWDLEFFGYTLPGTTTVGGWKIFARAIASSFLFLAGFSLVLAHGKTIRWYGFLKRLGIIVAAASAITVATYIWIPDRFIFFGILHCIAASSVVGLLFVRAPAFVSALAGLAVLLLTPELKGPFFDQPLLLWLGLTTGIVQSNDYVPLFPWISPALFGIAAGKLLMQRNLLGTLASIYRGKGPVHAILSFAGRHSLAVYLVHQPILIGAIYLFSLVIPAAPHQPDQLFMNSCSFSCTQNNEENFCSRYCACTLERLVEENLLETLMNPDTRNQSQPEVQAIARACSFSVVEELSNQ